MTGQRITRRVEFDAGHRIPHHGSKCRNLHGHRYVLLATVEGDVITTEGAADQGMVVDFSMLKEAMVTTVADVWDHAFLVWERDHEVVTFLDYLGRADGINHKTVILPDVPTAENLSRIAFGHIDMYLKTKLAPFHLVEVLLYETPNCSALATHA